MSDTYHCGMVTTTLFLLYAFQLRACQSRPLYSVALGILVMLLASSDVIRVKVEGVSREFRYIRIGNGSFAISLLTGHGMAFVSNH